MAAGKNAHRPQEALCSTAGISSDHTEAAVMTPAANPISVRCFCTHPFFFRKKTPAAPMAVPAKGIKMPNHVGPIKAALPFSCRLTAACCYQKMPAGPKR